MDDYKQKIAKVTSVITKFLFQASFIVILYVQVQIGKKLIANHIIDDIMITKNQKLLDHLELSMTQMRMTAYPRQENIM